MMYQPSSPLTMSSAKDALAEGSHAIESGATDVDLAKVSVVDSAAVAILLAWERAATGRSASITFHNAPPALRSLAALYSVAELLHFSGAPQDTASQRH